MSIFPAHPDELGDDFDDVDDIVKEALMNEDDLTDWEAEFVNDIAERLAQWGKRTRINEKQMEIIDRIRDKLNG